MIQVQVENIHHQVCALESFWLFMDNDILHRGSFFGNDHSPKPPKLPDNKPIADHLSRTVHCRFVLGSCPIAGRQPLSKSSHWKKNRRSDVFDMFSMERSSDYISSSTCYRQTGAYILSNAAILKITIPSHQVWRNIFEFWDGMTWPTFGSAARQ